MCNVQYEKQIFIKQQEGSRLLSKLGIRTPLSKIQLFGDIALREYKKYFN